MKILSTGSRHWSDRILVQSILGLLPKDTTIIHGAQRTKGYPGLDYGADYIVDRIGRERYNFTMVRYPVTKDDWRRYGRSAGGRRNATMYEEHPDIELVIAWRWKDPVSQEPVTMKGTDNCVGLARGKHNKPVIEIWNIPGYEVADHEAIRLLSEFLETRESS